MTSHDVVDACRRRLGVRRIGHAGTLDPAATGVLVLGIGRGARLLRFLEARDKEYRAEVAFGATTTTEDAEGAIVDERDAGGLTSERVAAALGSFTGDLDQIPPMLSAIKVGGERLYKKARRGEVVERAPRRVRIESLALEGFRPGRRAVATVLVRCSKGTYIRSLARDLGESLGVGGHLASLRRLAVGGLGVGDAVPLESVGPAAVRPMEDAVRGYPRREVGEEEAVALSRGRALPAAGIEGPYAVLGPKGLVAMAEDREGSARSLCVVGE
ncbi:MAG: tRNA pseudouridine(55) synthase TruB [Acidobacteria bacterium]|nr:tRNA pseudouridine(55) synthase TruB [Acidobacteriota bacterium]